MFTEEIRLTLQDVNGSMHSDNILSAVHLLKELIRKIRPLNLQQIQRLLAKAEQAAAFIRDKEIVLLVGSTGTEKSTTVHFLAGSKMKKIQVQVTHETVLEHITVVEPTKNSDLNNVTSNPQKKSETHCIVPVTVQLKDIFGPHEIGEITICDTPGFCDTVGPETDIANATVVIEAFQKCKSVKILALSSLKGLGDRAQGIQDLAHILIKMISNIEDRLDAIHYAFTKYPSKTDIHAYILNIKEKVIDQDPLLRSDKAFVAVLKDLIRKTMKKAQKIDPIYGDPKFFIETLQRAEGITFPEEAFRFSMSPDTQKTISNEAQRYEMSIRCAAKHKNIDLVKYYLDILKVLKDLTKEGFVKDAYEKCLRFISENIEESCSVVKEKFARAFESQDGLREGDVREYKTFLEYIQAIQKPLGGHLESGLVSPTALIQNIQRT
ncbi:unnamed protein product [Rotaria sp. Silwood2]|nr:unnamed protein product [Rotaria sp. Silwood2]